MYYVFKTVTVVHITIITIGHFAAASLGEGGTRWAAWSFVHPAGA